MSVTSQRIPNFTAAEKEILMEIIISRYAIFLEDKKTNKATIEKKQEVWTQIEAEFNNKAPIVAYRKQDQLRRLYENRKKELRKKMALYKNQKYMTGGGPPPEEPKLDKVEEILAKIINEKSVSGSDPPFDNDTLNDEPLAKISRKENENIEYSVLLDPTEQQYEFHPEDFETFVHNIEIPDISDFVEKQSQRCPPSGLQRPINDKLKVQPLGSRTIVEPCRENPSYITPSSSKSSGLNTRSSTKNTASTSQSMTINNKTSSVITPTKTLSSDRRRPMGGVKALTSSDVSEKYNLLLDKRLVLVEKQIEQNIELISFTKEQQNYNIKILKQQEENLSLEREEKILKIELLKAELKYKKSLFSSNI